MLFLSLKSFVIFGAQLSSLLVNMENKLNCIESKLSRIKAKCHVREEEDQGGIMSCDNLQDRCYLSSDIFVYKKINDDASCSSDV